MMMMALIEQATDVVGEYVFKKIDIFACGITMYYLLVGRHPLHEKGETLEAFK